MRNIQSQADAVMIGAQTVRITKGLWYPKRLIRVVVTASGKMNQKSRFFTDAPEKAIVACPKGVKPSVPKGVQVFSKGQKELDLKSLMRFLRKEKGVRTLLIEGGSELNASVLSLELVDELFLTLAPKIKLGRETPTYAGGKPLPRSKIQTFKLLEENRLGDELFLRYRRVTR
jgi:riboflavin biosynthesis pyrimidine reductase